MQRNVIFSLLLIVCQIFPLQEKILIITHSYNRPEFIELQYKALKTFLQNEYEFVVFNDARTSDMEKTIEDICNKLQLKHIRIPQHIHNYREKPSERTSDSIQYSLNILGFDFDGIVGVIDSDAFLIKELNINKIIEGYDLVGLPQLREQKGLPSVHYLWNGLIFMNMKTLPHKKTINFDCGKVYGIPVDSGGQLHHYLKDNPSLKIYHCDVIHSSIIPKKVPELQSLGFEQATSHFIEIGFKMLGSDLNIEFLCNNHFVHYRGGANWNGKPEEYHAIKTKLFKEFIFQITQ